MWTEPPDPRLLLPDPDEVQALVVRQLGATALFAAKFRENAARSLLLPKRRPGMRAPLWQQRKRCRRSAGGGVALRIVSGAARDLSRVPARFLRHAGADRDARRRPQPHRSASPRSIRRQPSPFAASLLFSYVASFLYDGDAPLAERRAQALAVDQAQLRELIGDAELRELLDADAMDAIERAAAAARSRSSTRGTPTACTTCCCRSAISPPRSSPRATVRRGGRRPGRRADRGAAGAPRAHRRPADATSPSRTRRAIATRSACRCRPACPSRCSNRFAIRSATSRCATRARMRRSPPPTSPRATAWPCRPPKRC